MFFFFFFCLGGGGGVNQELKKDTFVQVQRLARSFSTNRRTDKLTDILLLLYPYNKVKGCLFICVFVCMFVPKDLANRLTDGVLLNRVASNRSREGKRNYKKKFYIET